MADLRAELEKLLTSYDEKLKSYSDYLDASKAYRISKEVFDRYRQDVIEKLAPVQNIKIKFDHTAEKGNKTATDYYVWLKYNPENPDESQLVLQKISDTDNEPKLL